MALPSPAATSAGSCVRQTSRPRPTRQRGWNAQPGGSAAGAGGWPGIGSSAAVASSRGMLRSSAVA
jgi:hypothetical protein